jgi:ubiquinone/menaquinone biosynthesis C-methylase UbiE
MTYISATSQLLDPKKILEHLDISQGDTVADFGCGGNGHFIIPAARMIGQTAWAYAIDILKPALEAVASKARLEGLNNIKPVWADIEIYGGVNIKKKSLDYVLLVNNLFQSPRQSDILKEILRLLKKDGKLLIVDWNQKSSPLGPAVAARVKTQEIKAVAQKLKLQLVEEFEAGLYHYGLIFSQ